IQVAANEGIDWKQSDQKPVLTKIRASGADLVYQGAVIETGAQLIIRQMKDLGLVAARGVKYMGPDGLYEDELLKAATCDAVMAGDYHQTVDTPPLAKIEGIVGP